jgi:hypothetical protein
MMQRRGDLSSPQGYFYNILVNGIKPFLYRGALGRLLGIFSGFPVRFMGVPYPPPVGFRYLRFKIPIPQKPTSFNASLSFDQKMRGREPVVEGLESESSIAIPVQAPEAVTSATAQFKTESLSAAIETAVVQIPPLLTTPSLQPNVSQSSTQNLSINEQNGVLTTDRSISKENLPPTVSVAEENALGRKVEGSLPTYPRWVPSTSVLFQTPAMSLSFRTTVRNLEEVLKISRSARNDNEVVRSDNEVIRSDNEITRSDTQGDLKSSPTSGSLTRLKRLLGWPSYTATQIDSLSPVVSHGLQTSVARDNNKTPSIIISPLTDHLSKVADEVSQLRESDVTLRPNTIRLENEALGEPNIVVDEIDKANQQESSSTANLNIDVQITKPGVDSSVSHENYHQTIFTAVSLLPTSDSPTQLRKLLGWPNYTAIQIKPLNPVTFRESQTSKILETLAAGESLKTPLLIENKVSNSCYAHDFLKMETACHFERSEKSKLSSLLAALEMTAPTPIDEALCVTPVSKLKELDSNQSSTAQLNTVANGTNPLKKSDIVSLENNGLGESSEEEGHKFAVQLKPESLPESVVTTTIQIPPLPETSLLRSRKKSLTSNTNHILQLSAQDLDVDGWTKDDMLTTKEASTDHSGGNSPQTVFAAAAIEQEVRIKKIDDSLSTYPMWIPSTPLLSQVPLVPLSFQTPPTLLSFRMIVRNLAEVTKISRFARNDSATHFVQNSSVTQSNNSTVQLSGSTAYSDNGSDQLALETNQSGEKSKFMVDKNDEMLIDNDKLPRFQSKTTPNEINAHENHIANLLNILVPARKNWEIVSRIQPTTNRPMWLKRGQIEGKKLRANPMDAIEQPLASHVSNKPFIAQQRTSVRQTIKQSSYYFAAMKAFWERCHLQMTHFLALGQLPGVTQSDLTQYLVSPCPTYQRGNTLTTLKISSLNDVDYGNAQVEYRQKTALKRGTIKPSRYRRAAMPYAFWERSYLGTIRWHHFR